ncbi:cytochrome P450 [Aspergillus sclerotioniger CBS 115572]|uniref:Cytochrome P450 n=1 Tax=Aspergillus sclerotioniger CBS 115572 TaxID=1450535 RepID=A0A317VQH5_9EURO|nr:cytochrome P450 [Aspergillus sclerotioniger CBS 115572]PWY75297.1 cytochrome P450 [Aspergillus sclerotioniger CBS 115572]
MDTSHRFYSDGNVGGVILGIIVITFLVLRIRERLWNPSKMPVFNDRKWFEFGYGNAKNRYVADPEGLIRHGLKHGGDAFYLYTDANFCLILSPKYADMIRNDDRLDLGEFLADDFHLGIPGFEPFSNIALSSKIIQTTVKTKLARQTANLVTPLSKEASIALHNNWGEETAEWHQAKLKRSISNFVGQLSSRGFLGDEDLCRDSAWLDLAFDLLEESFIAAHILRLWPTPLRRLARWLIPSYRKAMVLLQEATKYIQPLLDRKNGSASVKGGSLEKDGSLTTALDWLEDASKGSAENMTSLLFTLSLAALDTSTDLLSKVMCDLSEHPNLVDDLRREIIEVLGKEKMTRSSLQRLFLLDSVMKESQRIRPLGLVGMLRRAKEKVVLPDGLIIPKATPVMVSTLHMMDSTVWADGDKYDGYRFFNLRKEANDSLSSRYQFTTTSPDHLGFGHGRQACPGRHYAATFGKIILCHIIMKYDFNVLLPEEGVIELRGHNMLPSPKIKINIRRRKEEISFE